MFESILTSGTEASTISAKGAVICLGVCIILGFFISLVYIAGSRKKKYSPHFAFTLVILPPVVCAVIMLVGSDIAKAISLGGVFALVRFRSVPGDSKDIASVFYCMSVGLAAGMGYIWFAAMLAVVIGILYFVLMFFNYGTKKNEPKELKITIPENLNFNGAFDDLFEEYSYGATLEKIKTTNLGTLYELTYSIMMKENADEKQFMDSIRCRNGNLNIVLCKTQERFEVL
ncbi:MAG: DUF4956 domain-containing protein [Lachnospiraceae bacterium]